MFTRIFRLLFTQIFRSLPPPFISAGQIVLDFSPQILNMLRFLGRSIIIKRFQLSVVPTVAEITDDVSRFHKDIEIPVVRHLQSRHLVETVTHEDLYEARDNGQFKLYCGADPSAESLHLGNLLPLMVLLHFSLRGHDVVGLVGGATGAVGDPSGRSTERDTIAQNVRSQNVANILQQISLFLKNGRAYAESRGYPLKPAELTTEDNFSWWHLIGMLDFLALYGKHIRVSAMLARDSVQSRLESQSGIGYNEFSYQILQAFDFWHLFLNKNVNMQIGGNDQWGNITAGIDLILRLQKSQNANIEESKRVEKPAYGLTVPLLTTPSGEKFGKSAGNAVFISLKLTSPFQLYQYFINTPDDMVEKLLKVFTVLPLESVSEIIAKHEADPGLRIAQRVLAREVSDLIHGVGVGDEMAYITSYLFPTPDQSFDDVLADILLQKFKRSGILVNIEVDPKTEVKMSTLLAQILSKSKTETKKLIKAGGIYLGSHREKFVDPDDVVLFDSDNHLIDGKLLLVRLGKQNYYVVEVTVKE